jgi:hypothetical protein
MAVTNFTSDVGYPVLAIRGYGQNNPGGISTTIPNPAVRIEASRGTNTVPTAMLANQNLGGITIGGFDGINWPSDQATTYNLLNWFAAENMTNNGSTATYQAGSGFGIFVQPNWTRPGINATRQRFLFTNWATTSSTGPTQLNMVIGSGTDGTAPTMTMVDGTTYTGYGRTNFGVNNAQTGFFGVPSTDTAPDNNTLTGTNVINIISGRRSGVSGRRNQVQINDSLGGLFWRSQSANNSTGNGNQNIGLVGTAIETQTAGAQGARLTVSTVNTGTTSFGVRMAIDDRLMTYNANQHQFSNGGSTAIPLTFTTSTWNSSIDSQTFGNTAGTVNMLTMNTTLNEYRNTSHKFTERTGSFTALNLTTSSAVFGSGVVISGYKKAYGDFFNTATVTVGLNTGTAIALTAGTVANCSIQSSDQILISQAGDYNLQFSIQIDNADNAERNFWVWLRKNGADIAQSATKYTILKNSDQVACLTFNITSNGTDYFQIMGAVDDALVTLQAAAANSQGFPTPAIPSVIVNLIPIGA